MDSIIAAHLPDFETWQSSCLLFDSAPYSVEENEMYLFHLTLFIKTDRKGEHLYSQQGNLVINCGTFYTKDDDYDGHDDTIWQGLINVFSLKHQTITHHTYYFSNGKKYKEYSIKDNIFKHGKYISYYKNGNVNTERYYVKGRLQGNYIKYDKNGDKCEECQYENGLKNGRCIFYYKGNIEIECYYKDNKLNGKYIIYYENGNIERESYYLDDKLNGKYVNYDLNNRVISIDHFERGMRK